MPHYRKIAGSLCYLSPPDASDAELWTRWLNDLDVALPLGDEAYSTITLDAARDDIGRIGAHDHVFTIVEQTTDRPVGRCLLFAVNQVDRTAMAGIFIGEADARGRGIGTEAMRLLLDYAFNLLNLNSVMLGVYDFNERAMASYRKVGFREIGRRRQARIVGGEPHDVVLMDLLASEFESPVVKASLERDTAR